MSGRYRWLVASLVLLASLVGLAQGQSVNVNFQQVASETPEGYLGDGGEVFADRGNGFSYGWDRDITADARDRGSANAEDQRYDTLNHVQKASPPAVWEIELENGDYNVYLVCGDPDNTDQTNTMDVEGVILTDPDGQDNFDDYAVTVTVADGRLTITASADDGASNAKISFVEIVLARAPEEASTPSPEAESVDVPRAVVLGWAPGDSVQAHDVYVGTVAADVENADRANPMDVLVSQGQSDASYDAGLLDYGQTYFWRVDEVLADNTIVPGELWSFTTEPFAYAVEGVIASSNAASEEGSGPEKTVDGSGLNDSDQHSVESIDMWLGNAGAEPIWLQYEFDRVYKLHEMLVWNYNVMFEPVLGFGLKDVTIEYSADGIEWTVLGDMELAQATAKADYAANTTVDFAGVAAKYVKITINSNRGGLPQYGLSEVRFLYIPAHAREPQPTVGETEVAVGTMLTWRAGREAALHDVYLGTDPNAMALVDSVSEASYMADALEFGSTYYWKVDEVNEADAVMAWEGDVWSFATQEYAEVDGFESYDDEDNRIYDTWLDGWVNETGSTVGYFEAPFAEQTTVNSGAQSMPLAYDNSAAPFYSEAERDLGNANWTGNGADTLRVFVSGLAPEFFEGADGSILMNGIGADIWGTADQFRYVYKNLTGDGSMMARVDDLDASPSTWAKAGIMIRQSTESGAVNAFMAMTGGDGGGATFQQRVDAGVDSVSQHTYDGNPFSPPYWVRLDRTGNSFSAFISPDGETWQQAGDTVTVSMADPVLVGLALTSHNADQAGSAAFSNVSFSGNVTGNWQIAEIGAAQVTGNSVEAFYVAVEDTAGHVATVAHPDAVVRSGWTEWLIPYSELSGVNLSGVSKVYVGVGDRDNPSAGGTGTILIDDLGFGRSASVGEAE